MRAINVLGKGREAELVLGEAKAPELRDGTVRIAVAATAVNRADLLQRRGLYPPPPGESELLGLECAGTIAEVAPDVTGFDVGDRVMALLPGGGYAEEAVVDAGSVMRVPRNMKIHDAAGVPEVFLTCYLNLFLLGAVEPKDWVLVHGGGSGIGTAAIQLLRVAGARVIVTCGSEDKCARCRGLGADVAINYHDAELFDQVKQATDGRGVRVILDCIGAPYFEDHLKALATGGKLVLIGLMGGAKTELNLGVLLAKRIQVIGSTLRTRSVAEKATIVTGFLERFGDALESGSLVPVIDQIVPIEKAQAAHDRVERSEHFGKVILSLTDPVA